MRGSKQAVSSVVSFVSIPSFLFGWAVVAGAANIPVSVTTGSSTDNLVLGISETLTTNVASVAGIGEVNEIDVRLTSIGGTYYNGAEMIPSTAGMNGLYGTWYFQGGAAYIPASGSAPQLALTTDGASVSGNTTTAPYSAGAANAPNSFVDVDTVAPAPGETATGAMSASSSWYAATSLTGGYFTTWNNNNLFATDATPGGTWGLGGGAPTGYGFDNTLIAAFYVSPATTGIEFYTDNGQPWNVTHPTGSYGQFAFNYGGGATDYVEINPAGLVWNKGAGTWNWDTTSANWTGNGTQYSDGMSVVFDDSSGGGASTVNVIGTVNPSSVSFNNNAKSYIFTGGAIGGSTSVIKSGTGTVTFTAANSYTGGTTISAGILNINSDLCLGAVPTSPTTNLTFGGNGTLQAGAAFALNANRNVTILSVRHGDVRHERFRRLDRRRN